MQPGVDDEAARTKRPSETTDVYPSWRASITSSGAFVACAEPIASRSSGSPEKLKIPAGCGSTEGEAAITAAPPIDAPARNTFFAPSRRSSLAAASTSRS